MSHAASHDPTVPRGAIIGAGVLLAFTLALTGAVTSGIIPQSADPVASRAAANVAIAQQRNLRFVDRADGAVVVTDVNSGETVKTIGFGEGGFLRATLRRMAKARIAAGIGQEPAFKLILWDNGAISLQDPATGREAEIHGFGQDHSQLFAEMLKAPAA